MGKGRLTGLSDSVLESRVTRDHVASTSGAELGHGSGETLQGEDDTVGETVDDARGDGLADLGDGVVGKEEVIGVVKDAIRQRCPFQAEAALCFVHLSAPAKFQADIAHDDEEGILTR